MSAFLKVLNQANKPVLKQNVLQATTYYLIIIIIIVIFLLLLLV